VWIFILPDGKIFPLEVAKRRFIVSEEGTGMSELEYITQRGPFQHGETVLDYFLRPRAIQFVIRSVLSCHDKYWHERGLILDALRPNRGEGVLRATLPGGVRRDIKVYVQQGPDFEKLANRGWEEWSFSTTLRLIAHDPVFYDPRTYSLNMAASGGAEFPIEFPLEFPLAGLAAFIDYDGTWLTYPTIVLTGPMIDPAITNVTTDELLELDYTLASGEVVTFSLQYGSKTIVSSTAGSIIEHLTSDSNLATFHLQPGINEVQATFTASDEITGLMMYWNNRYIGLGGAI